MKKLINNLLIFIILTTACSYSAFFVEEGAETYLSTNPDDIKLYSGDVDRKYEVIAAVASDVFGDSKKASAKIRAEAAKIGADAIIFIKLTKLTSIAQRTGVSGTAVRYTN